MSSENVLAATTVAVAGIFAATVWATHEKPTTTPVESCWKQCQDLFDGDTVRFQCLKLCTNAVVPKPCTPPVVESAVSVPTTTPSVVVGTGFLYPKRVSL